MVERELWAQTYGYIEKQDKVIHTCGNQLCMNLEHMELGKFEKQVEHRRMFGQRMQERRKKPKEVDDGLQSEVSKQTPT